MSQYYDQTELTIATFVRANKDYVKKLATEFVIEINKQVGGFPTNANGEVDQEKVFPYLTKCNSKIIELAAKESKCFIDIEWLWYIRRLPNSIFEGRLGTTSAYDRALCEVIGLLFSANPNMRTIRENTNPLVFETTPKNLKRLLRLCAVTLVMSNYHTSLRWCGKGADFQSSDLNVLLPNPTPEISAAVALYDKRANSLDYLNYGFGMAGTLVGCIQESYESSLSKFNLLFVSRYSVPQNQSLKVEGKTVSFLANYAAFEYNLSELSRLNSHTSKVWWHQSTPSIMVILRLGLYLLSSLEFSLISLFKNGYVLVSKERIELLLQSEINSLNNILNDLLPGASSPTSLNDLLLNINSLDGKVWPLVPSRSVFELGNQIIIDFASLVLKLKHVLEFPQVSGELGNARAKHFELFVQKAIDFSDWKPGTELKKLRGVTLRRHGESITDLDSIGEKDKTLLIVDCQSLLHDSAYDQGNPSKVNTAKEKIEKKVEHWNEIRLSLLENKVGDNFDFSDYDEIVAVVCMPQPFYVSLGNCTRNVAPSLMAACSLSELTQFLNCKPENL